MTYQPTFFKQLFHSSRRLLAERWLSLMPTTQIAITGSQGKTNTSSTLYQLLSSIAPVVRTDIDLDTVYNVPITALKTNPWIKYTIFELGIDRPGEMDRHLEIVNPKITVITGISPVHTDTQHLGSLDALIKEKRKLIEILSRDGFAVLNGDDKNTVAMAPFTKARVIMYGKNDNNDIQASKITVSLEGIQFDMYDKIKNVSFQIKSPLIGLHHIYTIMACFSVYRALGFTDFNRFQQIVSKLTPLKGRMSLEKGPMGTMLLDDSLRANPASTVSGLETLSEIYYKKGSKIAVLAEMGELAEPEAEHATLGKHIAGLKIDFVVTIGALHKYTVDHAIKNKFPEKNIYVADDVIDASTLLNKIIKKNDLLYLKGSFLRKVERIPMILNAEKVGCKILVCPFYHHCNDCKYKEIGFKK
ncbi:MAG: UDP-N-acetylmuramoyl-tripeptide--D-alanyl-D-alanine ligase [Patescibacteria group bacterium]